MQVTWGKFCEKKQLGNWSCFSLETTSKIHKKWIDYAFSGNNQLQYYKMDEKLFDLDKFEFKDKFNKTYKFKFETKFQGRFMKDGTIQMEVENDVIEFKVEKPKPIKNGTLCTFGLLKTGIKSRLIPTIIEPIKEVKACKVVEIREKKGHLSDHDPEEKLEQPLNTVTPKSPTPIKGVKLKVNQGCSLNSPTISDTTNQTQLFDQFKPISKLKKGIILVTPSAKNDYFVWIFNKKENTMACFIELYDINGIQLNAPVSYNEQQDMYDPRRFWARNVKIHDPNGASKDCYYYNPDIKSSAVSMLRYVSKQKAMKDYPYMKEWIEQNSKKK